jgi:hypothetical protein
MRRMEGGMVGLCDSMTDWIPTSPPFCAGRDQPIASTVGETFLHR